MKVLGIDGGGTRTRAAVVDEDGLLLAWGEGASINVDDQGAQRATENLRALLAPLRERAGVARFDGAFLGVGGVLTEEDRAVMLRVARDADVAPAKRIGVHHDAFVALEGGLPGEAGLLVVAGTGSIVFGRGADGREARCGNWGPLLGDEASGHWLGREGLRAVALAHDGRGPATALSEALLESLDVRKPDGLLHRLYVDGLDRAGIASLAPTVLRVAAEGDAAARELLERGCEALARCVARVHELAFESGETVPAIVTGGVGEDATWRVAFEAAAGRRAPAVQWCSALLPPVLGAARAALGLVKPGPMKEVDARLTAAVPALG